MNKLWARFGAYGVSHFDGIISPAYWVLRVDQRAYHPPFLHHLLRSGPFLSEIGRRSKNMPPNGFDLPWDQFRLIRLPSIPLDDQVQIAALLDAEAARVDSLLDLRKRQGLLAAERAQGELDEHVDRLFLTGQVPLKRLARGIEQGASPLCESRPADAGEWGVLKLSAVKNGWFNKHENKALPSGMEPIRRYQVREGDLLVTRANTPDLVGDAAVAVDVPDALQLCDLIYRVRLQREVSPEFVAAALLSSRVRGLIRAAARGSSASMIKLRGEDVLNLPLPLVDRAAQVALAQHAVALRTHRRELHSALTRSIRLLNERRESLITFVVSRQVDVALTS